jgi:arsenite methyltransferase
VVALRYSKATTPQAHSPREPETARRLCRAFRERFVHDPWLARRLPALVRAAGVHIVCVRSYGYVETSKPGFMLPSWVDLGADALVTSGRIGVDMAAALKAEARRRVASGEYFGHIAYMSVVARKPA